MLYKPKFCCECGVKVERIEWKLWTSRRFCCDCEIDKKAHEWLPKILAGVMVLFGLYGVGSRLLQPSEKPLNIKSGQEAANFSKNRQVSPAGNVQSKSPAAAEANLNRISNVNQSLKTDSEPIRAESLRLDSKVSAPAKSAAAEPVYFCGAQTKKGTPCSRRVKGGGRCWQHAGQAAMLPAEKLLINK
jgi:hypothetical protein